MTDPAKKSRKHHHKAKADESSLTRWRIFTNTTDSVRRMPVAGGFSGSSHAQSHR